MGANKSLHPHEETALRIAAPHTCDNARLHRHEQAVMLETECARTVADWVDDGDDGTVFYGSGSAAGGTDAAPAITAEISGVLDQLVGKRSEPTRSIFEQRSSRDTRLTKLLQPWI